MGVLDKFLDAIRLNDDYDDDDEFFDDDIEDMEEEPKQKRRFFKKMMTIWTTTTIWTTRLINRGQPRKCRRLPLQNSRRHQSSLQNSHLLQRLRQCVRKQEVLQWKYV